MVSASQIRAARALLGLSQPDVAASANVSTMTVKRAEGSGAPAASAAAVDAIRAALEAAGVEFIKENGGGAGVRLRLFQPGDSVRLTPGTALWAQERELQGKVGRVHRLVDDGTAMKRMTVVYPDGGLIEGVACGLFQFVPWNEA